MLDNNLLVQTTLLQKCSTTCITVINICTNNTKKKKRSKVPNWEVNQTHVFHIFHPFETTTKKILSRDQAEAQILTVSVYMRHEVFFGIEVNDAICAGIYRRGRQ